MKRLPLLLQHGIMVVVIGWIVLDALYQDGSQ
nr:MAG TPA: hypothetical protein [Caudoviricetes sp.]